MAPTGSKTGFHWVADKLALLGQLSEHAGKDPNSSLATAQRKEAPEGSPAALW